MKREIDFAVRRVLTSPPRLRFLFADGPATFLSLLRFLRRIVPRAAAALREIEVHAAAIADERTRNEALSSVRAKAYHVAGASILATFLDGDDAQRYIDIVAPLETIYDYLDNLCDRHPEVDPRAYPVLHGALSDALDPSAPLRDYYGLGPDGGDGGYLALLVRRTQDGLRALDGHEHLLPMFREAASFYTDLQTFKHLPDGRREAACLQWYDRNRTRFAHLQWYEFAAAAGSQWHVYVPLYLLFAGRQSALRDAYDAYFPSVAAIHVLLDAFIDHSEDRQHGELNLFDCYGTPERACEGMSALSQQSYAAFAHLPNPIPHAFLLRIMTLFYLTHPKVDEQGLESQALQLLAALRPPGRAPGANGARGETALHADPR